eukprot:3218638-Pyramimonas_sp.AAC.1
MLPNGEWVFLFKDPEKPHRALDLVSRASIDLHTALMPKDQHLYDAQGQLSQKAFVTNHRAETQLAQAVAKDTGGYLKSLDEFFAASADAGAEGDAPEDGDTPDADDCGGGAAQPGELIGSAAASSMPSLL